MQALELDEILFKVLHSDDELSQSMSGGIYVWERPEGSTKEDIVINHLGMTHDTHKEAVSNINIHVPDMQVTIDGTSQSVLDKDRIKKLSSIVHRIIENAKVSGCQFWITDERIVAESNIEQHYNNLRISWNIVREDN